jgi:hypothetical protein
MRVIPPLTITDAIFTSSTVAEPDTGETAWSGSSVSYTVDQVRIRTTTHRQYRCLVAHTSAASPTPENNPTQWEDIGPTNKWAMFDVLRNTATEEVTSPLTVVITPGVRVDSIALLGVQATSAQITMTSGGPTVYDSGTINLNTREVIDWYGYFFAAFSTQPSLVRFDLPPFSNGIITITLTAASGSVKCGACVIGSQVFIGSAELSAVSEARNFSTVDRTADGAAVMVQRRAIPATSQRLSLDKARVNAVRDLRTALNAVPAVWSGLDDLDTDGYFEALLILGFYRRFVINLAHPQHALIDLELEEV